MKTILAMGQSNAVGRAAGGGFNIPSTVTVWNNQNDLTDLSNLGTAFVAPNRAADPFVDSKNNMFIHAAKYFSQMAGEDTRLIIVAKGGLSIDEWDGKISNMYERMVAVLAEAGVTSVDGLLWHQGENDESASAGYLTKWQALVSNMSSDGYITDETPIIIGELAPQFANMHSVLHSLVDLRTDIAALRNLATYDDVHFTAPSLIQAGWFYAQRLFNLMPETEPVVIVTPNGHFATCSGVGPVTLNNSTDTAVPMAVDYGEASFFNASGAFVAPYPGVFHFRLQGFGGGGVTRLKLLDENLDEIKFVSYAGVLDPVGNNSILSGWCDISLPKNATVWLGLMQSSGASKTIDQQSAAEWCKMSVQVLSKNA